MLAAACPGRRADLRRVAHARCGHCRRTKGSEGVGASQPWSSLAALPLLSLPADNPIQVLIETHLAGIGRAHQERPTANLLGTLVGMVEAGLGHAVIPSFALNECLRRGLDIALLVEPAVHLDLFLVARRGTRPKPAALAFAAALKRAALRLAG